MKKVGILTFQSTVNYGAQLQNYALQSYISNFPNNDVYVINYDNDTVNSIEKKINFKDQKSIKDIIKYLKNGKSKKKKWEKFEDFRKKYIRMTKEYNRGTIKESKNIFDYYVVGSDQIWNLDITGNDYTYYLDFVNEREKKYSYAASFGKTVFQDKQYEKIFELLADFKIVNVREKSAEKMLKDSHKIKNVNTVMDPTFLLSKKEWIKGFELEEKEQDTIFVYMIDNVKNNFKKIKKFAKENKLKVVYINNDFFNVPGVKNVRNASPIEFLNYIYNAKYVITGSFHAICFSLIFNKNFYYIYNQSNGRNSRLIDLLNQLDINDQNNITNKEINDINLDYDKINVKIKEYINNSKEILNKIIKKWGD